MVCSLQIVAQKTLDLPSRFGFLRIWLSSKFRSIFDSHFLSIFGPTWAPKPTPKSDILLENLHLVLLLFFGLVSDRIFSHFRLIFASILDTFSTISGTSVKKCDFYKSPIKQKVKSRFFLSPRAHFLTLFLTFSVTGAGGCFKPLFPSIFGSKLDVIFGQNATREPLQIGLEN